MSPLPYVARTRATQAELEALTGEPLGLVREALLLRDAARAALRDQASVVRIAINVGVFE